jgi:quercetin dioxygenase-like cupin family protein
MRDFRPDESTAREFYDRKEKNPHGFHPVCAQLWISTVGNLNPLFPCSRSVVPWMVCYWDSGYNNPSFIRKPKGMGTMQIGHAKDVSKDLVTAEGATGASIQWLLAKKDHVPHFYMRLVTVEPGGTIPLHKHEVIHEMYILKGQGTVLHTDGESPIVEGDFVYMPSMEVHGTKNTGKEPLQFICCINAPKEP